MIQTNSLELIEGGRLKEANTALYRLRLRERVVREKRILSHRLHEIARRHGIGHNEVVDLLEEQAAADAQTAYAKGFKQGMIAARFSPLPPAGARRAA